MTKQHKGGEDCGVVSKATPQPPLYTLTAYLDDGLARNPSENQRRATLALTVNRFWLPFSINNSMTHENGQSTQQPIAV